MPKYRDAAAPSPSGTIGVQRESDAPKHPYGRTTIPWDGAKNDLQPPAPLMSEQPLGEQLTPELASANPSGAPHPYLTLVTPP
ncbi:hypothetical protein ABT298_33255 [Streptomyces sp. NPDC001034]|uniref:hypothetical protein n=1 Tax=Streptomyces sp. NPDC001034 TaxID=3154375 RepID=UPI00331DDD4F